MSVTALFLGHQDISRRLTGNVFSDEMWSLESLSAKEAAGGSVDGMCIPGAKVKDVRSVSRARAGLKAQGLGRVWTGLGLTKVIDGGKEEKSGDKFVGIKESHKHGQSISKSIDTSERRSYLRKSASSRAWAFQSMSPSPKPYRESGRARAGLSKPGPGLGGLGLLSPAQHNTRFESRLLVLLADLSSLSENWVQKDFDDDDDEWVFVNVHRD
ncbi:uncharacterized protein STEHIDRAFT_113320 [Stereum hirsutum FP-91666 SS1]|uniref:uncharacterized protein n=1 Tax=Stereum hirsutum (strain FP-91666) TaxID=721885 RepID=UPI000444A61B|nr:uncharacterized protein STEHIDRAFT_113320 [Stereum hirsutum FP-91666 SS1]EIM84138.1 hypothetical protein STEHIDRAFT_113320 [Stereum hirsutum FP-91666 SS1]